jgi:hypothetical protein
VTVADSSSVDTNPIPEVVRARPRRARLVAWIAAPVIVVVFTLIATSLRGTVGESGAAFQAGDSAAMIGLGVLAALGALIFTRPKVEADRAGIRVRNLISSYELPWEVVRAVRFGRGAPWVTLDLEDDDVVAVLAVQAVDRQYALDAVRGLRALHSVAVQRRGAPPA